MYKKTVTYEDFNGETCTETVYFNLSRDDLSVMLKENPDLVDEMQAAFDAKKGVELYSYIRLLVLKAYGVKAVDGKKFTKKVDGVPLSDSFEETAVYAQIMDDFITNQEEGAAFLTGVFPKAMLEEALKVQQAEVEAAPVVQEVSIWPEVPSDQAIEVDLTAMSQEELIAHFQSQNPQ